jgi:hypothetical protein
MKKLLVIPAALALASISSVAFADGWGWGGSSVTGSYNRADSWASVRQSANGNFGSVIHQDATVVQNSPTFDCNCKGSSVKGSYNGADASAHVSQSANYNKFSYIGQTATVIQGSPSFTSGGM